MRSRLKFVITAVFVCHLFVAPPLVISQARPSTPAPAQQPAPQEQGVCHLSLTRPLAVEQKPQQKPAQTGPEAKTKEAAQEARGKLNLPISAEQPVEITAHECEKKGDVYTLRGDVNVEFRGYHMQGDVVSYNGATGDVSAEGNLVFDGGENDIHLKASHGTFNVHSQTGRFYDVTGSTGARFKARRVMLTSSSPITFTGKMVEKTGEQEYVLHHGSVTSCELPHPKWTFNAARIVLNVGESAHVYNTTFRIRGIPVLYLPFAAPPVERLGRQSGFLVPTIGTSSTRGTVLGESFYWAMNRSMDATLGAEYLSKRGWMMHETFRATPTDKSYANVDYFGVLDHGIGPPGHRVDQGGEDVKVNGEALLGNNLRAVGSLDYLSSFVFRQAFTENFSQAVDSEVKSVAFLSSSINGYSFNLFGSRYQNFQSITPGDVITILHAPGLELSGVDQRVPRTPMYWSYDVAAEGLHRSEPGFLSPDLVGRYDVQPQLSLPLLIGGWTLRPDVSLRDVYYTASQQISGNTLTALDRPLNRAAVETSVEARPPLLSKVFEKPFLGHKVKHTIAPQVIYRYTNGADNLPSTIRFDFRDIFSDTHELEFGLVQRLYFKREGSNCPTNPAADQSSPEQEPAGLAADKAPQQPEVLDPSAACAPAGAHEFLTWEVKQKYFLDPTFGGVILNGRRNVLDTTVDFAGVAFLTDPRRFSPIVSRLRARTTGNSDMQWELDYDTKKGRINSSTFLTDFHFGDFFVGASHAFLQVPGEIVISPTANSLGQFVPLPPCVPGTLNQAACVPTRFNQIRALLGFGSPTRRGASAAANVGFDSFFHFLQYSAAQGAYNWDCCGVSLEYRRFALGSVRNENQFRFAFTLANIETFGNLKRQLRLF